MRSFLRPFAALAFMVHSFLVVGASQADVIIGNLPGNDGVQFVFDSASALSVGFTVGASPITLTSVDFRLETQGTSGNATLEIRNDNSGNPETTGFFFFNSQLVNTGAVSQYSFTSAVAPFLAANTTYWLTLGTPLNLPNALRVSASDPSVLPTGAHAVFFGLRTGDPDAQTMIPSIPPFSVPSFQINGTVSSVAVPEPPLFYWLLAGSFSVWICRKSNFLKSLPRLRF